MALVTLPIVALAGSAARTAYDVVQM